MNRRQLAKMLPHNLQEHDNDMRALIAKHMGYGNGNPTQWVVDVVHEAFQSGFGMGFAAGAAGHQMTQAAPNPVAVAAAQAFGRALQQPEPKRLTDDGVIEA